MLNRGVHKGPESTYVYIAPCTILNKFAFKRKFAWRTKSSSSSCITYECHSNVFFFSFKNVASLFMLGWAWWCVPASEMYGVQRRRLWCGRHSREILDTTLCDILSMLYVLAATAEYLRTGEISCNFFFKSAYLGSVLFQEKPLELEDTLV